MSLKTTLMLTVLLFSLLTLVIFIAHELQSFSLVDPILRYDSFLKPVATVREATHDKKIAIQIQTDDGEIIEEESIRISAEDHDEHERVGTLKCYGQDTKSEVIYWKVVPGDDVFESPITPHHGIHHDRYLTFEYDNGGWNNIRMSLECLIVSAHAMGRTVVLPPPQHLYLLTTKHKDKGTDKINSEMGFEDFFDLDILKSHKGFHVITMKEFLEREGVTGGLKRLLPPGNKTDIWGPKLWQYLESVADEMPIWGGRFIAFPDRPGDFNFSSGHHPRVLERMKRFGGDRWERKPIFYERHLQEAHHIHFPGRDHYRVLQHHYAFAFFASPAMQSFYKRFIRDYMRYRDDIQCLGHELISAVRRDAVAAGHSGGEYYSLHIRRGDFQYKDVKISAAKILENLVENGKPIIPPGAFVYISTDDPDGVCFNCFAERKNCKEHKAPKPVGCPDDPSWKAFIDFGWNIKFLRDYLKEGHLRESNPNVHGMVESIVCSRSKVFAGTWYSTYTGYIHRLRGYHGLGDASYFHSTGHVLQPKAAKSIGHGFAREFRAGWTDDAGELI